MTDAPFFMVGSGRSGTTLLRLILASHSRLFIPPETYFLLPLTAQLPADRVLTGAEVTRAVAIITGHFRWPDMGIDAAVFASKAAALPQPTLRDVVEIIYATHLAREGKQRWGDKTPPYIRIVPALAGLYPEARFIHLVRDGRDVAKSFQSVGWYGPLLHKNTSEWCEAMAVDRRLAASPLAGRFLKVRYEDLVRSTEEVTRGICEFLGEAYEPQMLSWQQQVDHLVPRREMHIHEKLRRPPGASDIERWRREMTAWEIFVSEAFMGRDLVRAGYARRFQSVAWSPLLAAARVYCRTVLPVWSRLSRRLAPARIARHSGVQG
jgi:hypothetical protein